MPRSVQLLRFATAIVTLVIVVALMVFTDRSQGVKLVAGGVILFGAMQWLFLGLLAKQFGGASQKSD